jgi:peptide/nickel transport system substrate-binding protein
LKYPVPYFLKLVSLPPYFPQYPALAQSSVPEPFAEHLIGNGPYVLNQFAVNDQIRLTANPAYEPQPATPTIVLRNFTRSQDLREALRNHEIDLVWRALVLEDLTDLEADTSFQVVEQPSTRMFYIYMNHHLEPFDDPLARQAVTLLLDRDEVVQGAFDDHVTAMTSLIPPQFEAAYDPIWPEDPDQTTAETALSNAGYSSRGQVRRLGFNIYFSLSAYGTLYENAANALNRGSFQVTRFIDSGIFDRVDTSTFIQVLERGEQENVVVLFGWTPIVPDPMAYLHPLAHSSEQIPSNGRYSSSEIDDLLDQAALLDDPVAQGDLYKQVQALLLENYDIAPLWQDHVQVVAWNDIDGIVLEPNSFLHYDQLARR